ncbi:type II toxin-antitoxin system RelE/ParE family toxin [Aquimarina sp. W85]|uniref:type II toxin-antitoxin system RelE/ParE family toxin n=1 Tax=Aquimarina rhodophyticola TaxID=3342246 RepID=UPI00366F9BEE
MSWVVARINISGFESFESQTWQLFLCKRYPQLENKCEKDRININRNYSFSFNYEIFTFTCIRNIDGIIAERPFSFESVDYIKKGYSCVHGFDSIFYKVNENNVEIVTIIGRQDLNENL